MFHNQLASKQLMQLKLNNDQKQELEKQQENNQEILISKRPSVHENLSSDEKSLVLLDISKTTDENLRKNSEKIEEKQIIPDQSKISETMDKIFLENLNQDHSLDIATFRENLMENLNEDYLTIGNLDKIQINNYQTQINEESDVKQDQINLISPQIINRKGMNLEINNSNKKQTFLNQVPKSPQNKNILNKDSFNASNNLVFQNVSPKKQNEPAVEVVGQIVGQQIKKTFNFLYDKLQEGVITTLNNAIENQKEQNKRSHSSNPSIDQQRFMFRNQNEKKIETDNSYSLQQYNQSFNYTPALSPLLRESNNIKSARESRSVFRQQIDHQQDKRPPVHTSRDKIDNKLTIKNQIIVDKNLLNELDNLRQEKLYLTKTIHNQDQQFQEQLQILQDKLKYKNEKSLKNQQFQIQQKLVEQFIYIMKEISQKLQIDNSQLSEDQNLQQKFTNIKDEIIEQYENQSLEIQRLKEYNLRKDGALDMKIEELKQKSQELFDLQEQQKQFQNTKEIEEQDLQNEREAYQLKMQLQDEKIQEMTKQIEDTKQTLKIQDQLFQEQEKQIQFLNNQLNEKAEEYQQNLKENQDKLIEKQNEVEDYKQLNKNIEMEYKQKECDYQENIKKLENRVEDLEQIKDITQTQVKQFNEIHLQKDKKSFKMEHDLEQIHKNYEKLQKELQLIKIQRDELQIQNQDNQQRLKITEFQLIQAKSSWAESEHEREQLFNRVQELEEKLDPGSHSQRSYQNSQYSKQDR